MCPCIVIFSCSFDLMCRLSFFLPSQRYDFDGLHPGIELEMPNFKRLVDEVRSTCWQNVGRFAPTAAPQVPISPSPPPQPTTMTMTIVIIIIIITHLAAFGHCVARACGLRRPTARPHCAARVAPASQRAGPTTSSPHGSRRWAAPRRG